MSAARIDQTLCAAIASGVLPATATRPAQEARPWPVVLLTGLGAWFAAIPLLGVVGMLLGDLISRSAGPYIIGVLVLAAAVVVLRARDVVLFVEQLAVPALLVGGGSLGFGLFRDLPSQAAAAVLAIVAVGLAMAIERPWLRVLLGAAAAMLASVACLPERWLGFDRGGLTRVWFALHGVLALWLAAGWLRGHRLNDGPRGRVAAALESIGAGWLLATLAGLAWWSGMSFLVGGTLGAGMAADIARELGARSASPWHVAVLRGVSLLLALVAAGWLARRWPALRAPWCAGVAAVLLALAGFMPALGGVLLALALCAAGARWRLAAAAALAAAWIIGSFYYQLAWPLSTKSLVLVTSGAVLGALAWFAPRDKAAGVAAPAPRPGTGSVAIAFSALAVLAVANIGIWQKEDLIAHGQPVYVELAPADPRSLMQGDFMRLNFRVPGGVMHTLDGTRIIERPRVVARRDARGVATLLRLDDGSPIAADELRVELTPKDGRWILVSDAWFFAEGDARRWERAKFGEFRVGADGRALLVGLRGADLQAL
ncbi:GDYXXLXY domain-containing protein [Piscinibacter sp.]|jgi:uncharacterized membrane-anchored protein|uniref:GDYXXLXY domain-containing protein n=1 Tax=Piscinibacter sp. TaxID=1903157 RepID=UPI002F3FDE1C